MNYLKPHTHDMSGDDETPRTMSGPATRPAEHDGITAVPYADPFEDEMPEPAPVIPDDYSATLTIRRDIPNARARRIVGEIEVKGTAAFVANVITWAADAFKEDTER